jgi:TatD DNase family protein
MARTALDLGFHLSFAGIVTFPRSAALREAAKITPAGRLLVETDSPYLAPVPFRGRRNEPAHVAQVYEALATVRGVPVRELITQVTTNFEMLVTA